MGNYWLDREPKGDDWVQIEVVVGLWVDQYGKVHVTTEKVWVNKYGSQEGQ